MKKLLKILPVVLVACVALTSIFAISVPDLEASYNNKIVEIDSPTINIGKTLWLLVWISLPSILVIVANWKIFTKAGQPGWACLVPVYGNVVQFKIVGLNPWLLLLYIVPIINYIAIFVLNIVLAFRLAKSFGKDIGWGFGLLFLPFIFYLILGLGSSKYEGPNGEMKF